MIRPGRLVMAACVIAGLAIASLTAPVATWRTGRDPAPALPLVRADSAAAAPGRVWIDSDAACGAGARTDSDDCLAVLALLQAPGANVVGLSSVAGNAPAAVTHRTLEALLRRLPGDSSPPLHRGGAPGNDGPTPAAEALRRALSAGPLTVVALGPLTNVAAALQGHPSLAANVTRLVTVMGRRRGHLFHPSEGNGQGAWLGHGPIFSDFNVRQDPRAVAAVLDLQIPITLVPYDAARAVTIDAADLNRLTLQGGAAAWVAARSRGWLAYWHESVGTRGFYPFDLLAAAYLLEPGWFYCSDVRAWVTPAAGLSAWMHGSAAVLVGLPAERPAEVRAATTAVYCPAVDPQVHEALMRRLLADRGLELGG